ncbi:MAG: triosephosphate isomerase [Candidatus Levybacteria bacterium]|nr:triosephosphate isomerase [Candidatus Levybacteria bacterium]
MKKLFIVANWKSNKVTSEVNSWLQEISNIKYQISNNTNKEIIVCPSFTLLVSLKSLILNHKSNIKLGAQDISPFDEGAYTGEVNGKQIKEFADYVLIGHSERQKYLLENKEMLEKKVRMAYKYGLTPIYFLQSKTDLAPDNVSIAVYEPPNSISPGIPDTPENANSAAVFIKKKSNVKYVFYGGNVTSGNVSSFTTMSAIDGVLVGRASLDAKEFTKIIQNA